MEKTNHYNYPSRYDLIQALTDFSKRSFVDQFAQKRGIFLTKAVTSDLANFLAGLFYEHADIEEIREAAYQQNTSSTLSGYTYYIDKDDLENPDPITAIERAMDNGGFDEGIKLTPLVKIRDENGEEMYKGTVSYQNNKPGRIELLQKEERTFDFYIKPEGEDKYRILVDCGNSKDSKVLLEQILKKHLPKTGRYNVLNIDRLTSAQTIKFFDELASKGMSVDNWEFNEVKQLIFRKGQDEEEEEAGETDLVGITQAILEGKNLRENTFVKQSERSGYRFTAMIYEYSHKRHPYVIEVSSEFKGRPKVFEVSIRNYKQREGLEEVLHEANLSKKEELAITSKLWDEAEAIYNDMVSQNLQSGVLVD